MDINNLNMDEICAGLDANSDVLEIVTAFRERALPAIAAQNPKLKRSWLSVLIRELLANLPLSDIFKSLGPDAIKLARTYVLPIIQEKFGSAAALVFGAMLDYLEKKITPVPA